MEAPPNQLMNRSTDATTIATVNPAPVCPYRAPSAAPNAPRTAVRARTRNRDRRRLAAISAYRPRVSIAWMRVDPCALAQVDLHGLALGLVRFEELLGGEAQQAADDVGGKRLQPGVEAHDGVVVELARERDPVLGPRQLLLEPHDVLVGLELGIVLDHCEELTERAGQRILGPRLGGGSLRGDRGRPRLGHLRQDLLLVLHVVLDDFDEIRNQIVATLELHVDLRPGVLQLVAEIDEGV